MYGKLDFLHAAFGIVPANLDNYESTLDSPAFDLNGIDGQFLLERVTQEDFYLRNGMIANGSRKAKRIHEDTFLNMDFMVPSLNEQKQIGDFFRRLNNLITLHQNKCAEPPRSRNFSLAISWEQRKFDEVFMSLQNNTLSRAKLNDEAGAAQNIHYGDVLIKYDEVLDVSNEPLSYIEKQTIADKFKTSYLQNGDVIIADTAEDETVGKCTEIAGLTDQKVISGLHTMPVRPNRKFAPGFLGFYLNSAAYHDQLKPLMQGIKVTSISKGAVQDTVITFPSDLKEQKEIGAYFESLDRLITLHQREQNHIQIYDYRSILHGSF